MDGRDRTVTNREAGPAEIRTVLTAALSPKRLLVSRTHDGALALRVLSDKFADKDASAMVSAALKRAGFELPERTLAILKAPSELEEGEEEALFPPTQGPWNGTPNWADALALDSSVKLEDERGFGAPVVVFWGVKGGVGRSTTLGHVGALLGRRAGVLAIDLDLDSPSIVATLGGKASKSASTRFDDVLSSAASTGFSDEDLQKLIRSSVVSAKDPRARFEMLGPVAADQKFITNLLGPLAPSSLYRRDVQPLRRMVRAAIQAVSPDVVLIDARAGYCDESAMSVLDLADEVVLFVSPAPSTFDSLAPAIEALERMRLTTGRPRLVHFVASMLPAGREARSRVLRDLQEIAEGVREALHDALKTPEDLLPPDVSIVPIDYSPRIVENEGTLQTDAAEGYTELAQRILPPPAPVMAVQEKGWVASVVNKADIPVPQAEEEKDPIRLAKLFTTTPQLERFVRHEVVLVLGAKGTGKSYLHRMCLEKPDILAARSGVQAINSMQFVDVYSGRRSGGPPVTVDLLKLLAKEQAQDWSVAWSALALARAVSALHGTDVTADVEDTFGSKAFSPILSLAKATQAQAVLRSVRALCKNPLRLDEAWSLVEEVCERRGRGLVLLFDALDVALGDSEESVRRRGVLIRGLMDRVRTSWLSRPHIAAKVFLREDLFRSLELEEEAKLSNQSIILEWRPEDIWRLVVRAMAVGSEPFEDVVARLRGIDIDRLEELSDKDLSPALSLVWGERLGETESNTRSTVWAERRLHDGLGRMFPRAALWLLRAGIDERKRQGGLGRQLPPVLDALSLRRAMPKVSTDRLAELKRECSAIQREYIGRTKGFDSYMDRSEFLKKLAPRAEARPEAEEALTALQALGFVEFGERRDKTPTVRIVDLYAFAPELKINRRGRR